MSLKPKVLMLGNIRHASEEWKSVEEIAQVLKPKSDNRVDFIKECQSGVFDGVIAILRTFKSFSITGQFDQELIQCLPASLKFVCHLGAGYDQINIAPCTAKGIRVSNVPTAVDDGTADINMFLIIGAIRNLNIGMTNLRQGKWMSNVSLGHDPQGKVLGIVGMGGIGRNLKKKAEAFGMKVQYYNRTQLPGDLEDGAQYVTFDELLSTSDVISLNLPLNAQTHHLISANEFAKMKDGVIIVNTARGAIIDEEALVKALDSGKVRSVGLDVYEHEPIIQKGLINNPYVMLVPHMGTYSVETQKAMEEWCIDNLKQAVLTGSLKSPVPEQASM